jgi:hypothetical protein
MALQRHNLPGELAQNCLKTGDCFAKFILSLPKGSQRHSPSPSIAGHKVDRQLPFFGFLI